MYLLKRKSVKEPNSHEKKVEAAEQTLMLLLIADWIIMDAISLDRMPMAQQRWMAQVEDETKNEVVPWMAPSRMVTQVQKAAKKALAAAAIREEAALATTEITCWAKDTKAAAMACVSPITLAKIK